MARDKVDEFTTQIDIRKVGKSGTLDELKSKHTVGPDEGEQLLPEGPKGSSKADPKGKGL